MNCHEKKNLLPKGARGVRFQISIHLYELAKVQKFSDDKQQSVRKYIFLILKFIFFDPRFNFPLVAFWHILKK